MARRFAGADANIDRQRRELDFELGDVIYSAIKENAHIESERWALERVDRVLARLSQVRAKRDEFRVVIPWIETYMAFTAPGRYIFFARSLFQLCNCDDMVAMVIAHEMSHHDLGHTKVFTCFANIVNPKFKLFIYVFYRMVVSRIYNPEQEYDADRNALEICLKAGYDGKKCISIFDQLEKVALDSRDIDGVYGLDEFDDDLSGDASWITKVRTWLYQRRRGYFPIRDRREKLLQHLDQITGVDACVGGTS